MFELEVHAGKVVPRNQILALSGQAAHAPSRWRARGYLTELFPGQFLVGHGPASWEQLAAAAVQWGGPGAALSHHSAAAVHRLEGFKRGAPLHLSIRGKTKVPTAVAIDLDLHTAQSFVTWDVADVQGLRVTSIERTLIDLGAELDATTHEQVVEAALQSGATRTNKLKACFERLAKRGTRGVGPMRELLARRGWTMTRVDSPLEKRFASFFEENDLPEPASRYWWPQKGQPLRRLDFAYRAQMLGIEIDSHRHHSSREDWAEDVARNNFLVAEGWALLRLTQEHLAHPKDTARLIREALDARGWEPPRPRR